MIRFEWELLLVHWEVIFEVRPVLEFGASPQVCFGNTDNFAVLEMELQVQGLQFIRHIEVCFLLDFLVGHESLSFVF